MAENLANGTTSDSSNRLRSIGPPVNHQINAIPRPPLPLPRREADTAASAARCASTEEAARRSCEKSALGLTESLDTKGTR